MPCRVTLPLLVKAPRLKHQMIVSSHVNDYFPPQLCVLQLSFPYEATALDKNTQQEEVGPLASAQLSNITSASSPGTNACLIFPTTSESHSVSPDGSSLPSGLIREPRLYLYAKHSDEAATYHRVAVRQGFMVSANICIINQCIPLSRQRYSFAYIPHQGTEKFTQQCCQHGFVYDIRAGNIVV